MTIHWKAVEQYFTLVFFVFQFYPVCYFEKFVSFGLGTVRSDMVKHYQWIENQRSGTQFVIGRCRSSSDRVIRGSLLFFFLEDSQEHCGDGQFIEEIKTTSFITIAAMLHISLPLRILLPYFRHEMSFTLYKTLQTYL